jgi:hypothetical protein
VNSPVGSTGTAQGLYIGLRRPWSKARPEGIKSIRTVTEHTHRTHSGLLSPLTLTNRRSSSSALLTSLSKALQATSLLKPCVVVQCDFPFAFCLGNERVHRMPLVTREWYEEHQSQVLTTSQLSCTDSNRRSGVLSGVMTTSLCHRRLLECIP